MTTFPINQQHARRGRLFQALVWLCALAFAWQLMASSAHHHELGDRVHDCVSCHIGGNLHGGVPPVPALTAPSTPALLYALPLVADVQSFVAPSYLIPPRQAPPAAPLSR